MKERILVPLFEAGQVYRQSEHFKILDAFTDEESPNPRQCFLLTPARVDDKRACDVLKMAALAHNIPCEVHVLNLDNGVELVVIPFGRTLTNYTQIVIDDKLIAPNPQESTVPTVKRLEELYGSDSSEYSFD